VFTDPSGAVFGIDDILIGAAIGAIIGAGTAAATGGDPWKGAAMGAVGGAFFGAASGAIGGAAGGASTLAQAGAYAAAGAAAGATNALIWGGDVGKSALYGGVFGFAGGLLGGTSLNVFPQDGSSVGAAISASANRVLTTSARGALLVGGYNAVTGQDVVEGMKTGALAWAAGETLNMAAGHGLGLIASGFSAPAYENGVVTYDVNWGGWLTLGNVIVGPTSGLNDALKAGGVNDPAGRKIKDHEVGHFQQGALLGPGYIRAHILSLTLGGFRGLFDSGSLSDRVVEGSHRHGLLERYWHPAPSY
jgi:hypothetical protein